MTTSKVGSARRNAKLKSWPGRKVVKPNIMELTAPLPAAHQILSSARLYEMGFAHNNCGGFCIKAGLGHFSNLLRTMPERYAFHEAKEQELRDHLGRQDITIVRDWATKPPKNISLRELRERIEAGAQIDAFDIGGCGCFVDTEAA